ncbi:class I SAM-dependent methyltransferase [Nocardiopsis tropica]|uniref:Class I SAM-dependent methyltransferase n=1 Tax=Nocardiopsis tropica TaxID=109330 RepID=A0ABU7KMG5_9ACTN|nr:class I SAM-dependent methyltransferase [Nocardiopsis umidischolae]MEE2050483.1 class I SAM-dependent methyltransferase [Nocardiopsis umidischolae]
MNSLFTALSAMAERPAPYARVTTVDLWTDPHISERMLANHLAPEVEAASHRGEFVDRATDWMVGHFGLGAGSRVADLGCGPGLYTTRLARAGAHTLGVDFARLSVDHAEKTARAEGLDAHHLCRDYLSLDLGERFDLIVMVMRDYCAMAPEDRSRLLGVVRRHLADGGVFLFDVDAEPALDLVREGALYAPDLMGGFWADRPYHGFRHTFRYDDERVSLDRYDIVTADDTRIFCNWVRYFTPDTLAAELADSGFGVGEVHGDLAGAPYDPASGQFAVVARLSD